MSSRFLNPSVMIVGTIVNGTEHPKSIDTLTCIVASSLACAALAACLRLVGLLFIIARVGKCWVRRTTRVHDIFARWAPGMHSIELVARADIIAVTHCSCVTRSRGVYSITALSEANQVAFFEDHLRPTAFLPITEANSS